MHAARKEHQCYYSCWTSSCIYDIVPCPWVPRAVLQECPKAKSNQLNHTEVSTPDETAPSKGLLSELVLLSRAINIAQSVSALSTPYSTSHTKFLKIHYGTCKQQGRFDSPRGKTSLVRRERQRNPGKRSSSLGAVQPHRPRSSATACGRTGRSYSILA